MFPVSFKSTGLSIQEKKRKIDFLKMAAILEFQLEQF